MTIDVQLEYADKELKTYPGFQSFKSSTDINATTEYMYVKFGGGDPSIPGAAFGKRGAYASEILSRIQQGEFKR